MERKSLRWRKHSEQHGRPAGLEEHGTRTQGAGSTGRRAVAKAELSRGCWWVRETGDRPLCRVGREGGRGGRQQDKHLGSSRASRERLTSRSGRVTTASIRAPGSGYLCPHPPTQKGPSARQLGSPRSHRRDHPERT